MKRLLLCALLLIVALLASCQQVPELSDEEILDMAEDILDDEDKIIVDKEIYDDMLKKIVAPTPTPEPTPEPTPTPKPTPAPVKPGKTNSSSLLPEDEYDVYADGELLISVSNQYTAIVSFELDQDYAYEGYTLQTKRGIQIGSTMDEVAQAYKGIPADIFDSDTYEPVALDVYIENNPDAYEDNDLMILYETAFVGDTAMSMLDFYDYLDENDIDFGDYLDQRVMYNKERGIINVSMNITFTKGVVSSVMIYK